MLARLVRVYALADYLVEFLGNNRGIYVGECFPVEGIYARVFLLLQHEVYGIYGEGIAAVFNVLVVEFPHNVGYTVACRICLKYMQKCGRFVLVYYDFCHRLVAHIFVLYRVAVIYRPAHIVALHARFAKAAFCLLRKLLAVILVHAFQTTKWT